jgi:HEAT repeat protein
MMTDKSKRLQRWSMVSVLIGTLMLSIGFADKENETARELDQLIDQLKHNNSRSRARAASALGKLGDERAVEPLFAALKDNAAGVRLSAAEALAELDWQPDTDVK